MFFFCFCNSLQRILLLFLAERIQDVPGNHPECDQLEPRRRRILPHPGEQPAGGLCGAARQPQHPRLLQPAVRRPQRSPRDGELAKPGPGRFARAKFKRGADVDPSPVPQVQMAVDVKFVQDTLRGDGVTEIRMKFIKRIEENLPAGDE